MKEIVCLHCNEFITASPRNKNHNYCKKPECQRARKAAWKRHKMQTDPEFKKNQQLSNRKWAKNNPGYWKAYRRKNPGKAERNRMLQNIRNRRREKTKRAGAVPIAKVDALKPKKISMVGRYWLVPVIAKVDALKVNILEISNGYELLQRGTR